MRVITAHPLFKHASARYSCARDPDEDAIADILGAVRDGLVGHGAAGSVVVKIGVAGDEVAAWLRSDDPATRLVALHAASLLIATVECLRRSFERRRRSECRGDGKSNDSSPMKRLCGQ